MDPRPQPEESYKIGSVRPSFHPSFCLSILVYPHLSVHLSQDWLVSFFWNLACCKGPIYSFVWQSRIFWKKSLLGKNDQKWSKCPKNMVFEFFKKIMSLVLSGICAKWKFLWFNNILQKLHAWEKSGSQVIAKNVSQPMRFQYSLIVNISLID